MLTSRDLALVFGQHPKYDLIDMKSTESLFKSNGYKDVDELETDQLRELTTIVNADVIIKANIVESRVGLYTINAKFFSTRSGDLKDYTFSVTKNKDQRLKAMNDEFMAELDNFVSSEIDKSYNIAVNQYNSQKYAEAEAGLKAVIDQNPDKTEAYYYLGATYFKTQKYDLAEQYLSKALDKNPTDQRTMQTLIEIYDLNKNTDKKLLLMEKIALNNNDKELWLAIGNIYDEQGNKTKAEEAFVKALEVDPNYSDGVIRYGFFKYEAGDFNGAIPLLEKGAELYPDNELLSDRLAASYFKANRISEAITKYEARIKSDPDNLQAYLSVAGLYRTQAEAADGKTANELNQKAINTLNQLKKKDPDNALVYLNLAAIYFSQKKNGDAETNANLAISKNSGLYQPYLILASINQGKGAEQYNRFGDLEQQAAKAVGKKADQLKKDRDAAKNSARNFFLKAKEQLEAARNRATDAAALRDINNRLSTINNLLSKV
jgi:tetratricopeptide (TPR) repeat protein